MYCSDDLFLIVFVKNIYLNLRMSCTSVKTKKTPTNINILVYVLTSRNSVLIFDCIDWEIHRSS